MKRSIPGLSRRNLEVQSRGEGDAAAAVVTGYGAVFYNAADAGTEYWIWDDIVERIMPGAFDRAIREDDCRSFFNHDANLILGRTSAQTLTLSIDATGLRYDVQPPATEAARHVVEAIRRRDVSGSSFMFEPLTTTWREEKRDQLTIWIREITEVRLWEIGPVVFPAYDSTTSELRSAIQSEPHMSRFAGWLDAHARSARRSLDQFRFNNDAARQRRSQEFDRRTAHRTAS